MANATQAVTGIIPIAVASGVALQVTKKALPKTKKKSKKRARVTKAKRKKLTKVTGTFSGMPRMFG